MYEIEALGTYWWIENLSGNVIPKSFCDILDGVIREFEDNFSRFNENSWVSKLSRSGSIDNPPKEMLDMLDFAREINIMTEGIFNPLVGAKLQSIGYGIGSPQYCQVDDFCNAISWSSRKVILKKDQSLDFGGFGKGWLIDKLAQLMRDKGIENFIINGGGDLYVSSDQKIDFGLEDPYNNKKIVGSVKLKEGALAASSTLKRTWIHNNKDYHHIIDPRSSSSTESPVIASFVIAKTALIADAAATVLIIKPELEDHLVNKLEIQTKLIRQ